MTPVVSGAAPAHGALRAFSWTTIAWVSALLLVCYAPVLARAS